MSGGWPVEKENDYYIGNRFRRGKLLNGKNNQFVSNSEQVSRIIKFSRYLRVYDKIRSVHVKCCVLEVHTVMRGVAGNAYSLVDNHTDTVSLRLIVRIQFETNQSQKLNRFMEFIF